MADLKILRICLSRDIPPDIERLPNYIYFGYDNLILYSGTNLVEEDFCIVDTMPESPKSNFIYILKSDGSIHEYLDYSDVQIAEVEDPSQVELLQKVGSTYFVNSESKYIDKQKRTLVLPYNNGVFELVTNAQNEQVFDNDTVLKYNEEHEQFEIYGNLDEFIDYSEVISGAETDTAKSVVSGSRLFANVKISSIFDNALKLADDGLYISNEGKVDTETFVRFRDQVISFENYCHSILDNLETELEYVASIISEESVDEEIHNQLVTHYPTIDAALAAYGETAEKLEEIETELLNYISSTLVSGMSTIDNNIEQCSKWDDVTTDIKDYTNEFNYYDRRVQYDEASGYEPDPGVDRLTTIFYGKAIQGDSRIARSFQTEVDAIPNDIYINIDNNNMYRCTRGGYDIAARWVYAGNIKYPSDKNSAIVIASAINLYRQNHSPLLATRRNVMLSKKSKNNISKDKLIIIMSAINQYIQDKKARNEKAIIISSVLNMHIQNKESIPIDEKDKVAVITSAINQYLVTNKS